MSARLILETSRRDGSKMFRIELTFGLIGLGWLFGQFF
jgi:hypothetical protein